MECFEGGTRHNPATDLRMKDGSRWWQCFYFALARPIIQSAQQKPNGGRRPWRRCGWLRIALLRKSQHAYPHRQIVPPTEFPNRIGPFRPPVRRRSRLAYALLSGSVDVNDGENCFLPKMALEGVITDERLDAAVGRAGRQPPPPQKPDNFCACLRAAWVQN